MAKVRNMIQRQEIEPQKGLSLAVARCCCVAKKTKQSGFCASVVPHSRDTDSIIGLTIKINLSKLLILVSNKILFSRTDSKAEIKGFLIFL